MLSRSNVETKKLLWVKPMIRAIMVGETEWPGSDTGVNCSGTGVLCSDKVKNKKKHRWNIS